MMVNLVNSVVLYRGELAALAAALLWAIASTIYARAGRTTVPLVLNLTKGLVAIVFMSLTLVIQQMPLPELTGGQWLLLVGSGIVGIGIGDTAFLATLNTLGPRRAVLLEALAPPLAALLAIAFLGEILGWVAYGGIALTVIGVAWVVLEQTPVVSTATVSSNPVTTIHHHYHQRRGLIYGLIAALCQAVGAVTSRAALANTSISPLWSGLIRLTAGTAIVVVIIGIQLTRTHQMKPGAFLPLRSLSFLALIITTAFGSTFLAIWLQQIAFKYAVTGIAQALLSTSPLFVIPFAVAMGDRVSIRSILGVLITIGGIWLLFQTGV